MPSWNPSLGLCDVTSPSEEGPVVAILTARGGSKRIAAKNIRPFLGVPILARTIDCVLSAEVFDRVIVSTDDTRIAEVADAAGAEVPFRRPAELADDHTGTEAVVRHAIATLEFGEDSRLGLVCAVYPTAVLATPADLRNALEVLRAEDAEFVFSATTFDYPIQRALRLKADGACEMFQPQHLMTRSQDLEPAFHDAGQFYWGRRDAWMRAEPIFTSDSRLFLLPRQRVQDIDTAEDWERAELLYQLMERG